MKTASIYVIYDPLEVVMDILEVSGTSTQSKSNLDGTYSPDRSLFPLVLRPSCRVKDPNNILAEDQTDNLIDCRWYIGSDDKGSRIEADTSGFKLAANGALQVYRNVEPTVPLNLFFIGSFIDPRTNQVFRKSAQKTLSCSSVSEINLSLQLDATALVELSPYKTMTQRTITATFRNGPAEVPAALAVFDWQVLDGGAYRSITADDIFYISGQGTKSLVIDRRVIDTESVMVTAWHSSTPSVTVSATVRIKRSYGQWDKDEKIIRGKFVRLGQTQKVEAVCFVSTPKGIITGPTAYFDIEHQIKTNEEGSEWRTFAYGESFETTPEEVCSKDPNVQTIFNCQVRELSALRPAQIGGEAVTLNNEAALIHIPL